MTKQKIYVIEYYTTHPITGWSNTVRDRVLAVTEAHAEIKFKEKHPDISVFSIVNVHYADY